MAGPRLAFRLALVLLLPGAAPAAAQAPAATPAPETPDAAIRATIARWYEELVKRDEGRLSGLTAPAFIDASPRYRHIDNGSRKLGPRVYTSLAATALKFSWEIDAVRRDETFAKVQVWERGYFYAWANKQTYELGAATTFVLERREADGRWLVLAHQSSGQGIPPNKITRPMPDMREAFEASGRRGPSW
jgi:hypothetical protein